MYVGSGQSGCAGCSGLGEYFEKLSGFGAYDGLGAKPWSDTSACPARIAKVMLCLDDPNAAAHCAVTLGPTYKPKVEHFCNADKELKKPLPVWLIPAAAGAGVLVLGTIGWLVLRKK